MLAYCTSCKRKISFLSICKRGRWIVQESEFVMHPCCPQTSQRSNKLFVCQRGGGWIVFAVMLQQSNFWMERVRYPAEENVKKMFYIEPGKVERLCEYWPMYISSFFYISMESSQSLRCVEIWAAWAVDSCRNLSPPSVEKYQIERK